MVESTQQQGGAKPKKFTDFTIKSLTASNGRKEYPVPDCRGLYVVVQPTGRRSFAVRFRVNGKPKKLTLARGTTLAKARVEAAKALEKAGQGDDPTAAKKKDKEAQRAAAENTFKTIANSYLTREGNKPEDKRLRSLDWRRQLLERLVYPTLGDQPIHTIKRRAIIELLDKIEDGELRHPDTKEPIRGGATMAHSTLAVVRAIMNWHQVRDEEFRSPIVRGMGRIKPNDHKRERVLGDEELRAIWTTAEQRAADPFAALVRFLLLTAARRSEAARLPRDEVKDGDWTLPARRNKVKLDLVRPLSKAAQELLGARPEIDGSIYYFTSGKKPLAAFSQLKEEFDEACGVTAWTLHDLRRTSRTLMSRAGVKPDHAEECLGHVKSGVEGTYDRHKFYDEKKQAYEAVAALIERIVRPPGGTVTELKKERRA
jgi:integrase